MIVGSTVGTVVWVVAGLLIMVVLWRTGMAMLQALSAPPVPPPEPGEMRKVNWSSRREIIGSTWIVISASFMLAAGLFAVDFLFSRFFALIGVLEQ